MWDPNKGMLEMLVVSNINMQSLGFVLNTEKKIKPQ